MMLEHMSVPVEYNFHSSAPSQSAVELRYAEAMTSADNIITARYVIRAIAQANDVIASFMPKPLTNTTGSGMFLYHSLFDREGSNLFWAPKAGDSAGAVAHLSDLGAHYVAGLLKYAPEFTLICNPRSTRISVLCLMAMHLRILPGSQESDGLGTGAAA
jgi:glutamine synthetase